MHQICDGYNPRVRMGNWFEESYSVPQLARTNPTKLSRDTEIDIGYLDAQLKLRPLNRMARLPPWNTSGLVQAPQYKDYHNKTTTKENFDLRTTEHYFNRWKPNVYDKCNGSNISNQTYIKVNQYKKEYKMFNDQTVKELLNERTADSTSFRSEIVPNKHVNQKALLQTIYQRDISENAQKVSQKDYEKPYPEATQSNFRRIRSEITLKNVPPFQTYK